MTLINPVLGRKFSNERELVQWENLIADAFHQKSELKAFDKMEYKVDTTSTRYGLNSDFQ